MTTFSILITGADRGLGFALTRKFLADGHQVCALVRCQSEAVALAKKDFSESLHLFSGDVSDEHSVQLALEAIGRQAGALDIVVNNAAVHMEQSRPPLEQVDFSSYLPTYQVNAVGPLMVAKYALPLLRRGRTKLIVNISSEAGSIGSCWRKSEYSYCMSKAALNMASRILQNALQEEGIKVLALHPGWFSSDMGGVDAPITPADAAEQVAKLVLAPPVLDGPIFVASDGSLMEW